MSSEPIAIGASLTRAAQLAEIMPDAKAERRVNLSFSSETALLREFDFGTGWEVLGHGDGEVNLSRLATGTAPLLKDHRNDLDSKVGSVERAWIEGGKGKAVVRLAQTASGSEMLARIRAGEVGSISVGYRVESFTRAGERDGLPVMRATKWTPHEISLVAVPADASVGIGRSLTGAGKQPISSKETRMTTQTTPAEGAAASRNDIAAERNRAAEINAISNQFGLPAHLANDAIAQGTSLDQFRAVAMDHISTDPTPTRSGPTVAAIHRANQPEYSLVRAISAHLTGDWRTAGYERECDQEERNKTGRAAEGFYVPTAALAGRALVTSAAAPSLIGTEHMGNAFIDVLRPATAVMTLGATLLPGLRGNISIPRMGAGTAAQWIAEDSAAAESSPTFDSIALSPKQLSANTRMSRKQVKQADPALEVILRNDLMRQIAVAVDRAAITGAGGGVEPLGILNMPGVAIVPNGVDGNPASFNDVMKMVTAVEAANPATGNFGFLSNHKVKAKMMSTERLANGGVPILDATGDGKGVAGIAAAFTSLVPSNLTKGTGTNLSAMIFGNFADLIIAQWGGIDMIVDDMTESTKGNVRVTAHSEWDIAVRHPESCAIMNDIVA